MRSHNGPNRSILLCSLKSCSFIVKVNIHITFHKVKPAPILLKTYSHAVTYVEISKTIKQFCYILAEFCTWLLTIFSSKFNFFTGHTMWGTLKK